jgi:hypothetical protein
MMKDNQEKLALIFIFVFGVPVFGMALVILWGLFLSMIVSMF